MNQLFLVGSLFLWRLLSEITTVNNSEVSIISPLQGSSLPSPQILPLKHGCLLQKVPAWSLTKAQRSTTLEKEIKTETKVRQRACALFVALLKTAGHGHSMSDQSSDRKASRPLTLGTTKQYLKGKKIHTKLRDKCNPIRGTENPKPCLPTLVDYEKNGRLRCHYPES